MNGSPSGSVDITGVMAETVTTRIADYVVKLDYDALPQIVVDNAKAAICDTIGVALAAVGGPVGEKVLGYARAESGCGDGLILGSDLQTSCEMAALVNGTIAHALDFDDRGHASTHTLAAAVALARRAPLAGKDLIVAYVAGREVRTHLDEVFDRGRFAPGGALPGSWGWHATGVFGSFGAVATAARVLRLTAEETSYALATAASLASGVIANFGTMTKPLHAGNAARNGVLSSLLAQRGWNADPDVFSAIKGFVDAVTGGRRAQDPNLVVDNLTSWFHMAERGIRVKPYPSCSGSHPFIEATRALLRRTHVPLDRVVRIVVPTNPSLNREYPNDSLQTKFSGGFSVVATLLTGGVSMETCTEEFRRRADVQQLMDKVVYIPEGASMVRIELAGEDELREPFPPVRNLDTAEERLEKFLSLTEPLVGADRAQAIADQVERMEDLTDVAEFVATCRL